jgi:hypothetical protein
MHGLPRGSRDKWIDRDPKAMPDSEESESENTQRYSVIPVHSQRSCLSNLYQINPPSQPPPPLPYQTIGYHHHPHQVGGDNSDLEDGDSSSSDPSKITIDRKHGKKDRQAQL